MNSTSQPQNLVLRVLAVFVLAVGVIIVVTDGGAHGFPPITLGLALLAVDVATRRGRGDSTGS
jgi:hypothetical protein